MACTLYMPGSRNDKNVLQRSSIFARLTEGGSPQDNYNINGHDYSMGYYLADDIYPSWTTFVKTIPQPQGNKNKYFAKAQEACRKDVESVRFNMGLAHILFNQIKQILKSMLNVAL